MSNLKPKRHSIAGRDRPLFWYQIGPDVAVFPFTRSRMNRTTLGCYGRSARTNPSVTAWMWGVCYMNADGLLPGNWDATMKSFCAPMDAHDARDLKKEAMVIAQERAARLAESAKAQS